MPLAELLTDSSAIVRLRARTPDEALRELAEALAEQTGLASEVIFAGLRERESLGSTGLGHALALPHTKAEIAGTRAVLGVAPDGLEFGAPDGEPVRVFVALVSSMQPTEHLRALALVSRTFADPTLLDRLIDCRDAAQAFALVS